MFIAGLRPLEDVWPRSFFGSLFLMWRVFCLWHKRQVASAQMCHVQNRPGQPNCEQSDAEEQGIWASFAWICYHLPPARSGHKPYWTTSCSLQQEVHHLSPYHDPCMVFTNADKKQCLVLFTGDKEPLSLWCSLYIKSEVLLFCMCGFYTRSKVGFFSSLQCVVVGSNWGCITLELTASNCEVLSNWHQKFTCWDFSSKYSLLG